MKTKIILTIPVILITFAVVFFTACKKDKTEPIPEAASIELVSGNEQTAEVLAMLTNPAVVLVKDKEGNAFTGASVSFIVSEGSVSAATVTTDANGNASVTWILGKTSGTQTLQASLAGLTGSPVEFSAIVTGVVDYDNNVYETVTIGRQTWMAEDLKVTHYPNGDAILNITDNTAWENLADNSTDDAYCFYDADANGVQDNTDYGFLYTYAAAIGDDWTRDNTANQGVCPDGWHLPTDTEWTELTNELGGINVGGKLKETGTSHWTSPNTGATNSSGFSALPGGYRDGGNGTFYHVGDNGYWCSSTSSSSSNAYRRYISYNGAIMYRDYHYKSSGFSVRCVRD